MRVLLVALLVLEASCGAPEKKQAAPITNSVKPTVTEKTALKITGIEPNKGDAEGGTYVRILGSRFTADGERNAKVYFGSRQGTVVRFASDTELIVEAPGGKAGETVDVLVILEPGGELTLPNAFAFVDKQAPTVSP